MTALLLLWWPVLGVLNLAPAQEGKSMGKLHRLRREIIAHPERWHNKTHVGCFAYSALAITDYIFVPRRAWRNAPYLSFVRSVLAELGISTVR